ncbi:MAG: carboxymuconolactone decarboxylase family protein [Pseudomonadota bacterium]
MSRISHVPVEDWDPELRAITRADEASPLEQGLMRMMAHTPEIAKGLTAFAGALKIHRARPDKLVELVRLRIAFHNQCRSCMAIRYTDAVEDGATEDLVCELAQPATSEALSEAEKAAIRYADLFATDHLSITDETYDDLRRHFSEAEIVELGMFVGLCVGFGRLGATWHMVEELPENFQSDKAGPLTPWGEDAVTMR